MFHVLCFMLIDTHCHLNFKQFNNDWKEVIDNTLEENTWIINVGTDEKTSQKAVEIAEKYAKGVYATIGFHPIYVHPVKSCPAGISPEAKLFNRVKDANQKIEDIIDLDFYMKLANHPRVVAIGEIGLDYYHTNDKNIQELQKKVLQKQLKIAKKTKKPVIFHTRNVKNDLMEVVKPFLPLKAVIHCFSDSWNTAQKYLDLGFLISFTGIITYTDQYNEAIKNTPLDKMMIETDSPYLAPVPYRGKRNEPRYVKYVAQKIADIKKISLEEVTETTTKNAREFFGI